MRVDPKDLRIGNLVYDTSGKVNTINLDAFKYLLSYGGTDICQVKPIPLTEEWLLKLGMKKDGYDYWSGPVYFELAECGDGEYINSVNSHEYDHGIKIKYVHSLQNLYFALTGEELKLNN